MTQLARISRSVTGQLGDLISSRPGMLHSPSPVVGASPDAPLAGTGMPGIFEEWLGATRVPPERLREMEYYDYLEQEIPDVGKALDAYATMAVTGNLAGGGRAAFTIRALGDETTYPDELRDRLRRMETMLQNLAYTTIRTMVKYGSYMPEIVPDKLEDGAMGVRYIKPIPPGTIFRYIDNGRLNPKRYWIQIIDGKPTNGQSPTQPAQNAKGDPIPQWMLPHFAVWTNVVDATHTLLYGTSLLRPFGAVGLKLHGTLDSMVLARLTRAAMRYIWKIDVSDIKEDQNSIRRRMSAWKNMLSRSQTLINSSSQADSYKRPPTPDQDFFVPAADGLSWDLNKIDGDTNLARVNDVDMLVRFYFGALGVPPEYLGHERSQGGRSVLSQIDIHFARTVRHIQMFGAAGFEHIVWVDMLLGGWDPREYPVQVVPPPIGARDDLLHAQIRALQASVIAQLQTAGMRLDLDPKWVLRTFLNMDEELEELDDDVVDALFEKMEVPATGQPPSGGGRQSAEAAIAKVHEAFGPIIRENLRLLAFDQDPTAGLIHRHQQPMIEELAAGLRK